MAIGETTVTVNGSVMTEPERRDLGNGEGFTGFMVISRERRYDKATGEWRDGRKFSVWVSCWRRLGHNVLASLHKGDDVIVSGRLRTRDYEDDGKTRYVTELDAYAVGANLTRAQVQIRRVPAAEHAEAEALVQAA